MDKQINQLDDPAPLSGSELLPADQGASTVKLTLASIMDRTSEQFPVYSLALSGTTPTVGECDAALVALGLDALVNRHFYLFDTNLMVVWEVRWWLDEGAYFAVPLEKLL